MGELGQRWMAQGQQGRMHESVVATYLDLSVRHAQLLGQFLAHLEGRRVGLFKETHKVLELLGRDPLSLRLLGLVCLHLQSVLLVLLRRLLRWRRLLLLLLCCGGGGRGRRSGRGRVCGRGVMRI